MSATREPAPSTSWGARCLGCGLLYPWPVIDADTRLCLACQEEASAALDALLR